MNVIFLDCTQNYGYQFSAANTKVEMMARGLSQNGATITILNGLGGMLGINSRVAKPSEYIDKVITYPSRGRLLGFVRNISLLNQDLKNLYREGEPNIVILSNVYLHLHNIYANAAHKYGYKVAAISHEWVPTIRRQLWIQNKLGDIYADTFGRKVEGILPISEYIISRIEKFKKPYLKTPILADFGRDIDKDMIHDGGLVYCVYAAYYRVIGFILRAYANYLSFSKDPMPMTLVLSGSDADIQRVKEKIREFKVSTHVKILTKLPYSKLVSLYRSAQGLIIPLDPNHEQDHARFSQKIAEYLSSGSPIITNNVGEIDYYFTRGKDAVICEYTVEGFTNAFEWIESHPVDAARIGSMGFELGKKEFNYSSFGKLLYEFLIKL